MIMSRTRTRARASARRGDWLAAADLYRSLVDRMSASAGDRIQLAHSLKESGDNAGALDAYRGAAAAYPLLPEGHRQLSLFLVRLGRRDAALDAAARAWVAEPGSVELRTKIEIAGTGVGGVDAVVQVGLASGEPQPVRDRTSIVARFGRRQQLRRARRLARQGDLAGAERAYCALLSRHPADLDARVQLGHVLGEQHRDEDALAAYRTALLLQPRSPEIHLLVGHALKRLGRTSAAFGACLMAWRLQPDEMTANELAELQPAVTVDRLRMDLAGLLLEAPRPHEKAAPLTIPPDLAPHYALHYRCLAGSIDAGR